MVDVLGGKDSPLSMAQPSEHSVCCEALRAGELGYKHLKPCKISFPIGWLRSQHLGNCADFPKRDGDRNIEDEPLGKRSHYEGVLSRASDLAKSDGDLICDVAEHSLRCPLP